MNSSARRSIPALAAPAMLAFAASLMGSASAQEYPVKPIRLIVPFAPGGGVDFIGRLIGQKLGESLGQQVVVENRPGAGAAVGIEFGMRAAPDGYTLTQVSPSYTINPSVRAVKFDPLTDVTPIILVGKGPLVVVAHPSLPARNAKELAQLARTRPDQILYGTSGQGTIVHLATELFLSMANVRMTHVPYKGGGPALVDVMAGQIQIVFSPPQTGLPHVKSGRVRAIGVTSAQRLTAEPSIPTFAESGVPGYEATNWHATLGPKGMPRAVVDRLNSELRAIVASPEIRKTLIANGVEPAGGSPDELMSLIRKDLAQWKTVIARAQVKVE
jgi:tripartite-type tricarboxylate transporter receptor subunit TctC